ncbi:hypothetical protein F4808DRAFT_475968 [Astrocystis sublimbata]|nr:hypothetical protein F4808DRAFT_475968 [Astrocystis sublimbata]
MSPAVTDLGSIYQKELDHYNSQLKELQPNEWPSVPSPRERAFRLPSERAEEMAKHAKAWSFTQGYMYGSQMATLRDSDIIYPRDRYQVGTIFSAPHHTASSDDERWVAVNDPNNTATPFGIVHSKYRKMVVVKVFGEHCLCLPIYSHNGRGLEGKEFVKEYVSIRDVRDRWPEPAEGIHPKLLAAANYSHHGKIVRGKSCVKLSEFVSHRYDVPATMEGGLENRTSNSRERLLKLAGV